ncbi:Hpt domain-containing protein [Maridesulfovibrio sp.]|uniref:Hpt domain-containing protein n=1 Tax=Maridesulfovibrio sp. TaxID=2795000 RepID=UPI0029CA4273|nr:Hpt domain-containing protein [Maridesulfovibrio sp.]
MSDVVFNKPAFYNHLGGDLELGNEILNVYIVDAPERLRALKDALSSGENAQIIKYSHALKGISATIRAGIVTSLAEQIEFAARKGDLETVSACIPQVAVELEKLLEVIHKHLGA